MKARSQLPVNKYSRGMKILKEKINHIVVLMLENRSFDNMLGKLYPKSEQFNGLKGDESNLHSHGSTTEEISVWTEDEGSPGPMDYPNPDPGELFEDMNEQLFGSKEPPPHGAKPTMGGFAQNYAQYSAPYPPDGIMHHYTPDQVPMISQLARNYAVCDAWYASAPCQTWPNRFFVHTGTAAGYENNTPLHFPYKMPTIFTRFNKLGRENGWKIYYHDLPQACVLADTWHHTDQVHPYERFKKNAAEGTLPSYSFIEPRYYTEREFPNDQHPPHDVRYGDALIADVYNTLQASRCWQNTLLIIIYDEHGGCYDHQPPPAAIPPEKPRPDQVFAFDRYGVRIPAVIVSPYIKQGTVLRAPPGSAPFDHTSVIATLRHCFELGEPLTERDRHAPDLSIALTLSDDQLNWGEPLIPPELPKPSLEDIEKAIALELNDGQDTMLYSAAHLPDLSGLESDLEKIEKVEQEIDNLLKFGPVEKPPCKTVKEATAFIRQKMEAFLAKKPQT